jgi:hypothetical protein
MITTLYNLWYKTFPHEMVKWWKSSDKARAKLTTHPDGHHLMYIRGEKYPMTGYPRGHLLFGSLSPLKHEIKNRVFNDSWAKLEEGQDRQKIIDDIKGEVLDYISKMGEECRYDMLPQEKLVPAVKEIYRAWSEVEKLHPTYKMKWLKEIVAFVLNEDDAYRFRVQYLAKWLPTRYPLQALKHALTLAEHAEVVGDMKERIRLLKRIVLLVLEDREIKRLFDAFMSECDWKKVRLTKADKYFFQAKYYKVFYSDPNTWWGRARNKVLY